MPDCCFDKTDFSELASIPFNYLPTKLKLDNAEYDKNFLELKEYEQSIKLAMLNSQKKYLLVGKCLCNIKDHNLYKSKDYPSFEAYISDTFNFSLRTAQRIMQIYIFLNKTADVGTYDSFSLSQLDEIVSISPIDEKDLLEQITPNMSVKTIRDLKARYRRLKELEAKSNMLSTIKRAELSNCPTETKSDVKNTDVSPIVITTDLNSIEAKSLKLNNKLAREQFLQSYRNWTLLIHIACIGINIYEYQLKNGYSLLCFEAVNQQQKVEQHHFVIYTPDNTKFGVCYFTTGYVDLYWHSTNVVVQWLTDHRKEIE